MFPHLELTQDYVLSKSVCHDFSNLCDKYSKEEFFESSCYKISVFWVVRRVFEIINRVFNTYIWLMFSVFSMFSFFSMFSQLREDINKKNVFFRALPELPKPPPWPQFGQLGPLFSEVEIQDLKISLELRILYILYNILYICNLKNS